MNWTETEIGQEHRGDNFLMFFGNKAASIECIQQAYPQFEFRFLNQVHGTRCIQSTKAEVEADAHFTAEKEVALCIRTADCTPILIANSSQVLAIHAGWRGALNKILLESIRLTFSDNLNTTSISLGPHIQKNSFQVDALLGNEFSSQFGENLVSSDSQNLNKSYVDLKKVLLSQLIAQPAHLWCSDTDTLSQDQYYSHRAEPENMGRNISFVARL